MARTLAPATFLATVVAALVPTPALATFPGRNGEIAFVHTHGARQQTPQHELHRYHARTGAMRRLGLCGVAPSAGDRYCNTASPMAVAPGGGRIAFASTEIEQGSKASLRIVDLATGEQRLAPLPVGVHGLSLYHELAWHPGGERLLATRPLDPLAPMDPQLGPGPTGIFALGLDGSEQERLVADASAPDASIGGRLAFVRRGSVHVRHPGGAVRRVARGTEPSFSPRGRWIAFTRGGRLYAVSTRGGRPTRLARGTSPAWSPDGRQIAFLHEGAYGELELRALSWRTRRVRRIPQASVGSTDSLSGTLVQGPEWLPRPR